MQHSNNTGIKILESTYKTTKSAILKMTLIAMSKSIVALYQLLSFIC